MMFTVVLYGNRGFDSRRSKLLYEHSAAKTLIETRFRKNSIFPDIATMNR